MAGHPAKIRRAPEHVIFAQVEDHLRRRVRADEISAGRVHDALWFSRRAGCVEDVEHVLRIHRLWRTVRRGRRHQLVIPEIAAGGHRDGNRASAAALIDDHVLDGFRSCHRFVSHLLQLHDAAAAKAAVRGDEQAALRVVDAIAQRFGAEAAKHHAMNGADARAGQHRNRQLGHERHVDRDAVAFFRAQRLENVRKLRHVALQIEVRQRALVARLAFPDDRRLVTAAVPDMTVDAIDAGVDLSAHEPLRVRRLPVEDLRPRPRPFKLGGQARPIRFRIVRRLGVHASVASNSRGAEFFGGCEAAVFAEEVVELGMRRVGHAEILLQAVSLSVRQDGRGRR